METYIALAIAIVVAFFCMYFYKRGVRDGMKMAERLPFEPIVAKPSVLMTKEEKKVAEEEKKISDMERERELQLNELLNYQPKHMRQGEQD